ncbi:cupin domain-containing protein [Leptospira sp. 'Mane']|uniref:cupin domain-containing protein n=1 Tax=Leptospira sp. 'Mane' TaxID=3387407 RepID=UPI00398AFD5E
MATILRKTEKIQDTKAVKEFLNKNGIVYESFPAPPTLDSILSQKSLNDSEKEELLRGLEYRFDDLKKQFGYIARDLVVLHDEIPGIQDVLAKFDKLHIHTDEEVRYIVDGSGVFGFIVNGEKFEVHVAKGDFISIPENTNHWFTLDNAFRIKAVRYFKDNTGWTPVYVDESKVLVHS